MREVTRPTSRRSIAQCAARAIALALLGVTARTAVADSIWLDNPTGAPLFANTKISRVQDGKIFFTVSGNEASRDLAKVARISVDDEPALTTAEEAFAQQRWDDAVDGYEKVSRASAKPWVREWAAGRLVAASGKSGRFDSAVAAYIAVILKDPAAAAASKPALPASGSSYLDTAAQQIEQALAGSKLSDAQRTALLTFLIEMHTARKDEPAANSAAAKLDEVLARDPNNPAAAKANARRKIQSAAALVDQKQFARAIAEIESSKTIFVEPAQQAAALYVIADAKQRIALASDKPTDWQDAALAFMRIVAHFKDDPSVPQVRLALLSSAVICEKLGDRDGALRLYEDVATTYRDDADAAAVAKKAIDRLRSTK
jgi:tetratricopeptide (TPR) repeat protein